MQAIFYFGLFPRVVLLLLLLLLMTVGLNVGAVVHVFVLVGVS